jgi:acyl-CoA thioester hydrolase
VAGEVHWTDDVLRFRDTDANGHVNNTVFSVLFESGRVDLIRGRLTPHLGPDTFFVIARLAVDFRAELHYPGAVRTASWIEALGRTSVRFGQEILCEGAVAARAESTCVLLDRATRRPTPIEGAARTAAEALLRPSAG